MTFTNRRFICPCRNPGKKAYAGDNKGINGKCKPQQTKLCNHQEIKRA